MQDARENPLLDICAAIAVIALYGCAVAALSDDAVFIDADLYRMLLGILNGQATGLGVRDPLHYGQSFSFGYLAWIYRFAGEPVLRSPALLTAYMHKLGYDAAVGALVFLWLALARAYGIRVATLGLILFAFSPLYIELGVGGHPILPAYMLLMAGAFLFFSSGKGAGRFFYFSTGAALLAAGMAVRADTLFVWPWIALTHRNASGKEYACRTLERAVFMAAAFAMFLLARQLALGPHFAEAVSSGSHTLVEWLKEFFRLKNIPGGAASALLGAGLTTVLAFAGSLIVLRREPYRLAGPLVIMLITLFFWLPVGVNARHFIAFLFGACVCIALVFARLHPERSKSLQMAVMVVVFNQLLAEALRPAFLEHHASAYLSIPDAKRTFSDAPLGWEWNHIATLQQRHRLYDAWAARLENVCEDKVVVMMDYDDQEQALVRLYDAVPMPKIDLLALEGFKRTESAAKDGKTFVFVTKGDVWPADPLADILKMPELATYKILIDPYTLSAYDHALLPRRRAAHDCGEKP
jgi:hypothetical protein